MLNIEPIRNGGGYAEYIMASEGVSLWEGKAAERMGLAGEVTHDAFKAVCEGLNPFTGKNLTQRMDADRVAGMDWTFSAPKSASIMALLGGDERIARAFEESARETMAEAEKEIKARKRRFGQMTDIDTGEMLGAYRLHDRTREDKGVTDPQLHIHWFVANATFDDTEGKWKAAKQHFLKKHAPAFEADFHMRFADKLADLGYGIRKTQHAFEIEGVSEELILRYSRTTQKIDTIAEEQKLTAAQKARVGPKTRGKKNHDVREALQEEWKARLTPEDSRELASVRESTEEGRRMPQEEITAPEVKQAWQFARDTLTAKRKPVDAITTKRLFVEVAKDFYGKAKPHQVHEAIEASGLRVKNGLVSKPKPRRSMAERIRRGIYDRIRQSREWVRSEMVMERGWSR